MPRSYRDSIRTGSLCYIITPIALRKDDAAATRYSSLLRRHQHQRARAACYHSLISRRIDVPDDTPPRALRTAGYLLDGLMNITLESRHVSYYHRSHISCLR